MQLAAGLCCSDSEGVLMLYFSDDMSEKVQSCSGEDYEKLDTDNI